MTTFLFPYSFSSCLAQSPRFPGKTNTFLPGTVIRDLCGVACYPPAPVGCCTIGLDGLVESVLVVVVDAAPSSRLRVMIHAIMGASSCLALPFPPNGWSISTKKSVCRNAGQLSVRDVERPDLTQWEVSPRLFLNLRPSQIFRWKFGANWGNKANPDRKPVSPAFIISRLRLEPEVLAS